MSQISWHRHGISFLFFCQISFKLSIGMFSSSPSPSHSIQFLATLQPIYYFCVLKVNSAPSMKRIIKMKVLLCVTQSLLFVAFFHTWLKWRKKKCREWMYTEYTISDIKYLEYYMYGGNGIYFTISYFMFEAYAFDKHFSCSPLLSFYF